MRREDNKLVALIKESWLCSTYDMHFVPDISADVESLSMSNYRTLWLKHFFFEKKSRFNLR